MADAKVAFNCSVFVNGIEVTDVAAWNIEDGWVECYVKSKSGYSNLDVRVHEFITSRIYGRVEVEFK